MVQIQCHKFCYSEFIILKLCKCGCCSILNLFIIKRISHILLTFRWRFSICAGCSLILHQIPQCFWVCKTFYRCGRKVKRTLWIFIGCRSTAMWRPYCQAGHVYDFNFRRRYGQRNRFILHWVVVCAYRGLLRFLMRIGSNYDPKEADSTCCFIASNFARPKVSTSCQIVVYQANDNNKQRMCNVNISNPTTYVSSLLVFRYSNRLCLPFLWSNLSNDIK